MKYFEYFDNDDYYKEQIKNLAKEDMREIWRRCFNDEINESIIDLAAYNYANGNHSKDTLYEENLKNCLEEAREKENSLNEIADVLENI